MLADFRLKWGGVKGHLGVSIDPFSFSEQCEGVFL